jgi:hypothetical protein
MTGSKSNVIRIDRQPVPSVVELLRDYLAQAERGEIRAISVASIRKVRGKLELIDDFDSAGDDAISYDTMMRRQLARFEDRQKA